MNWKLMLAAMCGGLLLGLAIAPFGRSTVLASPIPSNTHFQIRDATVDEQNGEGQNVLTHEVFLLDTDSGKIWKFQGLIWGRNQDGSAKVFSEPHFYPVRIDPAK